MPPKTISAASIAHRFPPAQSPPKSKATATAEHSRIEPAVVEHRESSDEAKLNKTEKLWLEILRSKGFTPKIHALTFKLAYRMTYTPEFMVTENGRLVIWEVKGAFIREDAWLKLKMASRMYPEFIFKMAQFTKDKKWVISEVPT